MSYGSQSTDQVRGNERVTSGTSGKTLDRRRFLTAAGLAGAAVATSMPALAQSPTKPDPAITELPDWSRYLGDGVAARPYGSPSKFEKNVVRRNVDGSRPAASPP